jgi:alcohol dehydrogenase, propanol-preferring
MRAMILDRICRLQDQPEPLRYIDLPKPHPSSHQILIKVTVCGVCHTELDEIEGRTLPPMLPLIPGHQVVGRVEETGTAVSLHRAGDRVGVAWIAWSCGHCAFCLSDRENLCPEFVATGRDVHGGYAEYICIDEHFAYTLPGILPDACIAPLLCAGAIGYRSLRLTGLVNGQTLGLTGFGASAHLVLKLVKSAYADSPVFVFARNAREREFALSLGAAWSGDTLDPAPALMNAIIDTTPAWLPVVGAMRQLTPGGRLVINAIRKNDADRDSLLKMDYARDLWMEKEIKTVANVSRNDVTDLLTLAGKIPLIPEYTEYVLEDANKALRDLHTGGIRGAKVLRISDS